MKVAVLFDGASALCANPDMLILETVEYIENGRDPSGCVELFRFLAHD